MSDKQTTDLKPCPFCGCTAIYVTHTHYYDDEDTVCMFCNGCKSVVMLESNEAEGINDKTRAEAIAAWNTRAERTCKELGSVRIWQSCNVWSHELSCGHDVDTLDQEPPNYCPNCGARVVD